MTRTQTLSLTALCCAIQLSASAQWTAQADIPTPPFNYGYSFVWNGMIYVGAQDRSLSAYDPVLDTWTTKAAYPGNGTKNSTAFVIGSTAYVGLGNVSGTTFSTDFWAYDPVGDSWSARATFPGAARGGASAFVVNGRAYVCGGTSAGGQYAEVYSYNPAANTWSSVTTLPTGTRGFTAAFAIGNFGYVYGGYVGFGNETNQLHRYDPAANAWSQMANYPGGGRQSAVAFVIDGKGYVGMGHAGFTTGFSNFFSYSPATDSWLAAGSFPAGARIAPVAAAVNGQAFLGSGADLATFQGTNDWWLNSSFVGITDQNRAQIAFDMFPVPASDLITLRFREHTVGVVSLWNALGESVRVERINSDQLHLRMDDLPAGAYVVRLVDQNGTMGHRAFTKQ